MRYLALLPLLGLLFPALALAAAPLQDKEIIELAVVVEAGPSVAELIEGTGVEELTQTVTIEMLEGPEAGTRATFENDFTQVKEGDKVYVRHSIYVTEGTERWSIADPYRLDVILAVAAAFLALLLLFGGLQGVRGLASLAGSLVLIFWLLIPSIYNGHSPVLVAIGVASLIIILGSYVTHGFNRTTTVAMLGMLATVVVTGIATYFVIGAARLSGFSSEENVYLNFMTEGRIDMIGLLFGGIMIGLLGVLYDIAIGQAVSVEELLLAGGKGADRRRAFWRAMRIGREHIGALVNTLAIAYVGSSLPLLLLFMESNTSVAFILNSEIFATEIIRILMGSIGLVLAVPVTTAIAAAVLRADGGPAHVHAHAHRAQSPKNSSE